MIDSPSPMTLPDCYALVDYLSPQSSTWIRGFSLTPVEPRIRAQIVSGYLELLEAATYLGNVAECVYLRERIEQFGGQPS